MKYNLSLSTWAILSPQRPNILRWTISLTFPYSWFQTCSIYHFIVGLRPPWLFSTNCAINKLGLIQTTELGIFILPSLHAGITHGTRDRVDLVKILTTWNNIFWKNDFLYVFCLLDIWKRFLIISIMKFSFIKINMRLFFHVSKWVWDKIS